MHISIETVEGKNINLEVEDSSKTINLKIYGTTRQLVIHLGSNPNPDPVFQIFIKTLSGKTITAMVKGSTTVEELKAKCKEKYGLRVDRQRLIYNLRQLENGRTLANYNIQRESIIRMALPLYGC